MKRSHAGFLAMLVLALLLWAAPDASAHATVVSTSPLDGSILTKAPTTISVVFDESVEITAGSLVVFTPGGQHADTTPAVHPPGRGDAITVTLTGATQRGTYTAAWRVVSADSHPVSGGFTFSIGVATATSVNQAALSPPGSVLIGVLLGISRWVGYLCLSILLGTIVFLAACWPGGAADRRIRTLIIGSWSLLFCAAGADLVLQGPYGAGTGIGEAFDGPLLSGTLGTQFGWALAGRLFVLLLALPLVLWIVRRWTTASRRARSLALGCGAVLAICLVATWPIGDHSGTGMQVPVAMPVDMAHLLAMAVWIGGLVVLSVVILPREVPETVSAAVPRFSAIAFGSVVVLALSGGYQAWRQVGTVPAFTATAYGRLVLYKIAGLMILICLGYAARRWISANLRNGSLPGGTALRQLRTSVGFEVVVAVSVLVLAAVMVNAQPARAAYNAPIDATVPFDTGGPGGTGTVSVQSAPPVTGLNHLEILIHDSAGRPVQAAEVDAALLLPSENLGPLPVIATDVDTGDYAAYANIPLPGTWQFQVTVRTDAIDEATVVFHIPAK